MRKSHPIRRALLATAATVSGIVLLLSLKPASDPASASAAGGAVPQQTAAGRSAQGGAEAAGTTTVTGDAVRTQYGPVQVRLTVRDGRVAEAAAVQAPERRRAAAQMTADCRTPTLTQAAVAKRAAPTSTRSPGPTLHQRPGTEQSPPVRDRQGEPGRGAGASRRRSRGRPAGGGGAAAAQPVTGAVAETRYGPVQVRITVSGGQDLPAPTAVRAPEGRAAAAR
ncbi:FMN-binding domain-containing protein OS=Streptomyces glaucescens OX=1907 GN=SGLAU_06470 PE=4 SV=1 [Streptomyces glaucescens]